MFEWPVLKEAILSGVARRLSSQHIRYFITNASLSQTHQQANTTYELYRTQLAFANMVSPQLISYRHPYPR